MDSKLTEQNKVINENIKVIQSQQQDIDQLNDEFDVLVQKVTVLTDDNKKLYDDNLQKSLEIKNLQHSLKEYQNSSGSKSHAPLKQVPETIEEEN